MNHENAAQYLPLVQALADGKVIQYNYFGVDDPKWKDVENVEFDEPASEYRIKPEPRELWFNRYATGGDCGPYSSESSAALYADPGATQVRYREVLE